MGCGNNEEIGVVTKTIDPDIYIRIEAECQVFKISYAWVIIPVICILIIIGICFVR